MDQFSLWVPGAQPRLVLKKLVALSPTPSLRVISMGPLAWETGALGVGQRAPDWASGVLTYHSSAV
jgi:hypothetical protein